MDSSGNDHDQTSARIERTLYQRLFRLKFKKDLSRMLITLHNVKQFV